MPYRADEDALLARNDALAREAEALRRENQRLRDRPSGPRSSELALSLSLLRSARAFDIVLAIPTIAAVIALAISVGGGLAAPLAAVGGICVLLVAWQISQAFHRHVFRRELAWIARGPCGLDARGYRALLAEHHEARAVTARVGFDALDDDARAAIAGGIGIASRWDGDVLVIDSPRFATQRGNGHQVLHDSGELHAWVRELVDVRLAAIAPAPVSITIADRS